MTSFEMHHAKNILTAILKKIKETLKGEQVLLSNEKAAVFLFLSYYQLYKPNDSGIEEQMCYTLATSLFNDIKQGKANSDHNFYSNKLGVISIFEHVTQQKIIETDIGQAFKEMDAAVLDSLVYGKALTLSINGVLGKVLYMYLRLQAQTHINPTDNMLRYEAIVLGIDEIARTLLLCNTNYSNIEAVFKGEYYYQDLSQAIVLLAKFLTKRVYPEIAERLYISIAKHLNQVMHQQGHLQAEEMLAIGYGLIVSRRIYQLKEIDVDINAVLSIVIANCKSVLINPENWSLRDLITVQRFNRLYQISHDDFFMKRIKQLYTQIDLEEVDNKRLEFNGITGLALCTLSYLNSELSTWDEIFLLS